MTRRRLLPATLVVCACASLRPEPDADRSPVVWALEVIQHLAWIQREARTETVLCLEGHRVGGRYIVDTIRPAVVTYRTATGVRYEPCPRGRYLGTAHNHPRPQAVCVFSYLDTRTWLADRDAALDVVTCERGGVVHALIRVRGRDEHWLERWEAV